MICRDPMPPQRPNRGGLVPSPPSKWNSGGPHQNFGAPGIRGCRPPNGCALASQTFILLMSIRRAAVAPMIAGVTMTFLVSVQPAGDRKVLGIKAFRGVPGGGVHPAAASGIDTGVPPANWRVVLAAILKEPPMMTSRRSSRGKSGSEAQCPARDWSGVRVTADCHRDEPVPASTQAVAASCSVGVPGAAAVRA